MSLFIPPLASVAMVLWCNQGTIKCALYLYQKITRLSKHQLLQFHFYLLMVNNS